MKQIIFLIFIAINQNLIGQIDSTKHENLVFTGDFRFRIEQDWNSQNQDGIQRKDRSRLRYRFRFGLNYSIDKSSSFGGRIRSGNINDQQGPHVTIGGNQGEFGLTSIGLEKLFYQYKNKYFTGWVGKNSIPLVKLNEVFWNDNVFPEGIGVKYKPQLKSNKLLNEISLNAGHFIIKSKNKDFSDDSYLQIIQLSTKLFKERLKIFPGFYQFKKIGNYPDGKQSFEIDYSIFHLGSQVIVDKKGKLKLEFEVYNNFQDYSRNDSIPDNLKNETLGIVLSAEYGAMKNKGDWLFYLSYANMQKYSIVDYFAQNDWSRWDYSSVQASGSRISNFQGVEIKIGYAIKKNFNLNLRTYIVEQLVKVGDFKENRNRMRLDLNIGF
ncbi:MAG: putative porin [Saprospiraceae bacterium]